MTDFDPDMTLREARDWMFDHIEDGAPCPCCDQFAKVYRRKLNDRIGKVLIAVYHKHLRGDLWVYLPGLGKAANSDVPAARSGEHAFAQFWGLLERNHAEGGRGHWRLTELGRQFVRDEVKVAKYARIYAGRLIRLDDSEMVGIREVLATPFDYDEMMRGE